MNMFERNFHVLRLYANYALILETLSMELLISYFITLFTAATASVEFTFSLLFLSNKYIYIYIQMFSSLDALSKIFIM